jgi:hypothetical protein
MLKTQISELAGETDRVQTTDFTSNVHSASLVILIISFYKKLNTSAPCSAGYFMTESGCQICGENTFSGVGASVCTDCPVGAFSAAGSTSEDDCKFGKSTQYFISAFL